ncbi:hemocyanin B chain-like [Centruroides vittatus]|uniref:hemocyanin B chain-like n=1 Tax=Centruroides vittatus TaxID=120091 RepID=UPI00350EB336
MAVNVEEKQQRLLPLFQYVPLLTKEKFSLKVERDERLEGLGILGRGVLFSYFHRDHLEEARHLFEILISAPTFDEFMDLCHQARDFVNEGLYIYAVAVAILHRSDCRHVTLPPVQEIFPEKFVPIETLLKAYKLAAMHDDKEEVIVKSEKTGNILDPEYNLAYYREDIGINAHHWHWHLVYPATWRAEVLGRRKDRKGELFYYMHQQMCARYDSERLSNGLPRMIPFHNFHDPLEGYSSHLASVVNGQPYASRPEGVVMQDMREVSVQEMERWRERILDAIHLGSVIDKHGKEVSLDEDHGIDVLGNLVESSYDTINDDYYGSLHNWGHVLMARAQDHDGRYQTNPGVMSDTATSLRDPIFYRWHRFIDDMFQEYKKTLPNYNKQQLGFVGVEIQSVTVKTEKNVNAIQTFFKEDALVVSHGLNFNRSGAVKVTYEHLDHEQFTYKIKVSNQGTKTRHAYVRIFLAPKFDELGNEIKANELRRLMIELDKFATELEPGINTIERSSRDSSVTVDQDYTFHSLLEETEEHHSESCNCGWPQHLLIPKGKDKGMPFHLFVMLTDFTQDFVPDHAHRSGTCADAVSYCGLKDELYPDKRPMGFPFDREIEEEDLKDWLLPNMSATEISIMFNSQKALHE